MTKFKGRADNGRGNSGAGDASLGSMKSTSNMKQQRTTSGKLFDQINQLKEKIVEKNQTIDDINTVIEGMQKKINKHETTINSHEETINEHELKIARLGNSVAQIFERIVKEINRDFKIKMTDYKNNPNDPIFQEGGEEGPISTWDTKYVCDMSNCFAGMRDFNEDISKWDTSYVKNMNNMFYGCHAFNQDISTKIVNQGLANEYLAWDTSNVEGMSGLFWGAHNFNNGQNASESTASLNWDTTNVTNMRGMFGLYWSNKEFAIYKSDGYDKITDPSGLIMKFNQDISKWNTGKVTDMGIMFQHNEYFNQDISGWDINNVTDMDYMFHSAFAFEQNLKPWDGKFNNDFGGNDGASGQAWAMFGYNAGTMAVRTKYPNLISSPSAPAWSSYWDTTSGRMKRSTKNTKRKESAGGGTSQGKLRHMEKIGPEK